MILQSSPCQHHALPAGAPCNLIQHQMLNIHFNKLLKAQLAAEILVQTSVIRRAFVTLSPLAAQLVPVNHSLFCIKTCTSCQPLVSVLCKQRAGTWVWESGQGARDAERGKRERDRKLKPLFCELDMCVWTQVGPTAAVCLGSGDSDLPETTLRSPFQRLKLVCDVSE